jgi:hypothetical protein
MGMNLFDWPLVIPVSTSEARIGGEENGSRLWKEDDPNAQVTGLGWVEVK